MWGRSTAKIQSLVGIDSTGGAAGNPVDLKTGPGGDLFYVDMEGGTVHRITYAAANQPPDAVMTANPTTGSPPLTVNLSGVNSSDPEGRPLVYSWDLNGDNTFGDASGPTASYTTPRRVSTARLCGSPTTKGPPTLRPSPSPLAIPPRRR
jgi:PKD repeat protein